MKRMTKIIALVLVAVCMFALTSCGKSIVGRWETSFFGSELELEFTADGEAYTYTNGEKTSEGTYEFEDDVITIEYENSLIKKETIRVNSMKGDTLDLNIYGVDMVFKKVK